MASAFGPMAQDFYATFNVGTDDRHIAPVDENGVELAAIQALKTRRLKKRKQGFRSKAWKSGN